MTAVNLHALAEAGGALAHPGRLRILALLGDDDLYVCQIRAVLGLAAPTLSMQLAALRRGGLVAERKEGRFVRYGLTREEPLGRVVREIPHLVREDRQIQDDARVLEAVRRIPREDLCRRMSVPGHRTPACPRGRRARGLAAGASRSARRRI
jgi:DNA-binding transcriptional ArsR family regulator